MADDDLARPPRRPLWARAAAGLAPIAGRGARVQGFVDAVLHGDTVVGWARDPRDLTRRLEIQLLNGKEVIGFGVADLPRKDLLARNVGDGKYGFRIRLAPGFLDGAARSITVCAVTERGKTPLQRGAITVGGSGAPATATDRVPEAAAKPGPLIGALERLSGRALHGWAYNPDQPDAPALVDFYDDERYLGSVLADRSRPRLYEKGLPSGARGFVFELPAEVEAEATGRLRARVAGTVHDLRRTRGFEAEERPATEPTAPASAPAPALPAAPASPPRAPAILPAQPIPVIALWSLGREGVVESAAAWAAQSHAETRLVTAQASAELPGTLAPGAIALGTTTIDTLARETGFVVFAPAGWAPPPELAGAIASLPRFPDVVVMTSDRAILSGEGARTGLLLAPARRRAVAVRSDLLLGLPPELRRSLEEGSFSAMALHLAERHGLLWAALAVPGAPEGMEAVDEQAVRTWRALLDAEDWSVTPTGPERARAPGRISIALWDGWEALADAALRRLVTELAMPLDLLVPTGGDPAQGVARLGAIEAAITGHPGARARIVDTPADPVGRARALLAGADGDVVLLTSGPLPSPDDLLRLARWSLHPAVGPVGLVTAAGWSSGATLGADGALRAANAGEVADMISFGMLAVATPRVAIALPDSGDGDPGAAAFLWARRLAGYGFHPATIAGTGADATPLLPPGGSLPWALAARARAEGLLDGG